MRESGEVLVRKLDITSELRVLDLGCGDGTTAVPAAQLGADVLGVDIASNLVAAGNERAAALGVTNLRFQEGDATDLKELDDDRFDLVVSIFGAMFAPKPSDVAKEMVRVTKPGGRIVMGNWILNDPTLLAQILKISSAYSPPPPEGFISPMTWGDVFRIGPHRHSLRSPLRPTFRQPTRALWVIWSGNRAGCRVCLGSSASPATVPRTTLHRKDRKSNSAFPPAAA
jgi:SAM-dependent methyltransferase